MHVQNFESEMETIHAPDYQQLTQSCDLLVHKI